MFNEEPELPHNCSCHVNRTPCWFCDELGCTKTSLLGAKPSRAIKVFRTEFPATFRFNGALYQEFYDIDSESPSCYWIEISEEEALEWLKPRT